MATEEKTDGKGMGGKLGFLLPILVLTLLGGGGGTGLGMLVASNVEQTVTEREKAKPPEPDAPPLRYAAGETTVQPLEPIVTNLAAPSSTFVRVEAAMVFKTGTLSNPTVAAAEIRDDILSYLRTLSLSQIEGPSGLLHLRADLDERAKIRTEGHVDELIIQTLVVQ